MLASVTSLLLEDEKQTLAVFYAEVYAESVFLEVNRKRFNNMILIGLARSH